MFLILLKYMSKTTPSPSALILGRGEQQGIKVSILKRRYLAAQALATNAKFVNFIFDKISYWKFISYYL